MRWQLTDRCLAEIQRHRAAGGTQQELALWCGMHAMRLSRWVHRRPEDRPGGPTDQRVRRLATVLELRVDETVEPAAGS